jgi:cbb3-type cytochrome oxidase subunit 3
VSVIILTVFIGLLLVAFFVIFFLYQTSLRSNADQDALMPLQDEKTASATKATVPNAFH